MDVIKKYKQESRFTVNWISSPDVVSAMMRTIESDQGCVGAHADLIYATEDKVVRYWKMEPQKSLYTGWMRGIRRYFSKGKFENWWLNGNSKGQN